MNLHGIFGNGTGFINTQHIDPGKRLDTLHIMYKNFFRGQSHYTDYQSYTGQQI